ncbi:MAG: deoxyribodipyrimidine photolyase [Bacteroidetes bacterium]|nr:deoxyribodipyrimidine photolyase [Bacteroidota bacterium]
MTISFPTEYAKILERMHRIDPINYSETRNYLNGAVTLLSPYLSRGVISTRQVFESLIERGFSFEQCETLIKELAWRDYFQRTWQVKKDLSTPIRQPQEGVERRGLPASLAKAKTGVPSIDEAIDELTSTGYMHNHCRMYTASVTCNIARYDWLEPARWMYYHLLDADWASNACSWQWVAGANSTKKYYCNQENINHYTGRQDKTFLSCSYEDLLNIRPPGDWNETVTEILYSSLPAVVAQELDPTLPVCVYNFYNLDPLWRSDQPCNRVLLLEPDHFSNYPVHERSIHFMLELTENIPDLMVFSGSWSDFKQRFPHQTIYFKEHPLFSHYEGQMDQRAWLVPEVQGHFNSFSGYWKKIEHPLKKQFTRQTTLSL